ncbi:UPF0648 protein [Escovopsis weberi]|uniref:UPF0648 protein n=1 Tax=Escovopsis weberi TaxID=150374 RepID=A0A0M9VRP2_ESCWE|nr:UPF0648 protein [Escovopsis weberi]
MALFNMTFLFGILVLGYLLTFVFFAVFRTVTGVSIQRIGYLSLRRLAFAPNNGLRLELRSLGFNVHRPTFAQPTWISIVLSGLVVTVDLRNLDKKQAAETEADATAAKGAPDRQGSQGAPPGGGEEEEVVVVDPLDKDRSGPPPNADLPPSPSPSQPQPQPPSPEQETWRRLQKLKEKLKKLHRIIKWLRLVDVVATNSVVNFVEVGRVEVGSFTLAVDTRHKGLDRARFFFQRSDPKKNDHQAEWILTLRSVVFTARGNESIQVLDQASLNIHGFLDPGKEGLRDAIFALKLGRVHIPYDDIQLCADRFKQCRKLSKPAPADEPPVDIFVAGGGGGGVGDKLPEGEAHPSSENLAKTVSDSKEFLSSILRGIKEVQFAVSFISMSKQFKAVSLAVQPVTLSASMKEVGFDLHRLDPKTPAHRMYFSSKDIAHEALLAALSISVGIEDDSGKPERILYIPMATSTIRTTSPSKTIQLAQAGSIEEKNANILFANSVVTSPSVDLDPRHLPLLMAILRARPKSKKSRTAQRRDFFSRLMPKANIKFTMHEPVLRIKLKPIGKIDDPDDYGLIISSISSMSIDVESSHSPLADSHYSLDGAMRLLSHELYYQASVGERFNLITTESLDLKVHLAANPHITVEATSNVQSFSISMVRPEITDGVGQIVRQLQTDAQQPEKRAAPRKRRHPNFLRSLPEWLGHYSITANDLNIEVAGVDKDISDDTRGVSLHLDSMSADYRAHRVDAQQRRQLKRRTHSRSYAQSDSDIASSASLRSKKKPQHRGDGRRIAFHARGIEALIIEAADRLEADPFLSIPRLELALSASSDNHGPMFHVHSSIRTILVQYSLFRHYAVGVAAMTLGKAFARPAQGDPPPRPPSQPSQEPVLAPVGHLVPPGTRTPVSDSDDAASSLAPDTITVDVKVALLQVKGEMPQDPMIMFRVYNLDAGKQRWSTPYFSSKLIRLFVATPRMHHIWARMVSVKNCRLDLRESKLRTSSGGFMDEKLLDIATEAIRIGIPYEVVVHRITDNFNNTIKAVQQLHHRFKTGTNEYIQEKKPEGPKAVPKVSLRSRTFLFEMEDGALEWKLGMIYRAGRLEQVQRLAREEAYRVKLKKVREEECRKGGNSKNRSRSTYARGRSDTAESGSWFRSRSADAARPEAVRGRPDLVPRYDPEGESLGVNGNAKVSAEEARLHLDILNAQSWKKRIASAYRVSRESVREQNEAVWGAGVVPNDVEETENILEVPQRPPLMSTMISNLHIVVDKPSFPISELPDFLHKVGKGMPRDMQYSLLVPMNIAIEMGEARVSLRDYPLPLLHIPRLKAGQSSRLQSVSLKANFVLAEEFRGLESTRMVSVNIIPPQYLGPSASNPEGFSVDIRRTLGPVKSFSDVYMDINTALPTRLTWGPSYQPAIQDMMMVIESFSKPSVDPSERVGFWDKLRLNFHSRIHAAWKEDGDMLLALKGTRDPYQITGHGTGFLMCWRNDIRWSINAEDEPTRFMTVDSGEYVLAIPDYSHQVREAARVHDEESSNHIIDDSAKFGAATFKKVVMKLSGKVQWMAGLIFEQAIDDGKRSFEFKPHYEVVLKNPLYATSQNGQPYDAMRGFRSRHIHLSIAIRAPMDREWLAPNNEQSRSYNALHLTPRFFTHFFAWWGLFSGPTSLPIRQGNLFPGREKNSKKFGRHLATVKFNLLLAPLFLSHIYKHKDADDYAENAVSATGLKVRFDSFMLDLHQRREEFNTIVKTKDAPSRISGIKIHAAQLDLVGADLRAVSASLKGTTTEAISRGSISDLITEQDERPDLSRFTIPDDDFSWIDMDDFVELDWLLPTEPYPDTKILPLAYVPRLTYFRQTDIGGTIGGDPTRTSPFGDEPTHSCIMSHDDDPKSVQAQLIQERLNQLEEQILAHSREVGQAELKVIQTDAKDREIVEDFETLRKHTFVLKEKKAFLQNMLDQMRPKQQQHHHYHQQQQQQQQQQFNGSIFNGSVFNGNRGSQHQAEGPTDSQGTPLDIPSQTEFDSEFENRFVVHNMQLKWNNLLRNIVLRYIHQSSQRRGFIYYLSRPAVKFILDIVEEQKRAKTKDPKPATSSGPSGMPSSTPETPQEKRSMRDLEDRLRSILSDGRKFTSSCFNLDAEGDILEGSIGDLESGISDEFTPQSSYHVRLIAPQIQLQSEKNQKHVVLVTAKGMELKVLEVMEKARISDAVSGLVQRRFLLNMDSTQFFVTHQKWFLTNLVSMYAGSKYGTPTGSSWPPWVPMEVMFDFQADPFGFKRIIQKTSALCRLDKYNPLRLKYDNEVNGDDANGTSAEPTESRSDNLWVEFPQARALCNSSQYYAVYVIVLDLLMYSEPQEKTNAERLEKIMLASDFSDLSGTPEMVMRLQERIRQMEEIKQHFQIYSKFLDKKGWEDRLALERDLAACEDELFFMMKAISTSQQRHDKVAESNNALLKWSISVRDIVWHLMQDSNEPLVELQLKNVEYDRTDNTDGSHMNLLRVGKILGLNLLPDATYPEIIAPYHDIESARSYTSAAFTGGNSTDMIQVYWYMLDAIAGITVMERFEVNLFPIKVQLEREVGKRLFEYIFPGMDGEKATAAKTNPPIIIGSDIPGVLEEEDEEAELSKSASNKLGAAALESANSSFSTRPGSLELRLRPTLSSHISEEAVPKKSAALSVHSGEGHSFRLFRTTSRTLTKKSSFDSLKPPSITSRPTGLSRSTTGLSSSKDSTHSGDSRKPSRFGLRGRNHDDEPSDDLTKMMSRASNYMTFAYIKMPSVVLCLSYKGKDQRNFEDVHDFVFRLPMIEWQNKTWSNLDLALALKKAVMKALISHTGAIIGNKFSKHRPNAEQRSKLRELASSSALIMPVLSASSRDHYAPSIIDSDDSASVFGASTMDFSRSPPRSTRSSIRSGIPAARPSSRDSSTGSIRSFQTGGSGHNGLLLPAHLTMTPSPSSADGNDLLRPSSSHGLGSSHRPSFRNASGGDVRPSTSSGHLDSGAAVERRRAHTGGLGLRDKISAFTHRMSHRDNTSGATSVPPTPVKAEHGSPEPQTPVEAPAAEAEPEAEAAQDADENEDGADDGGAGGSTFPRFRRFSGRSKAS